MSVYSEEAMTTWREIVNRVESRLEEHFTKWGDQRLSDGDWLKVIVEEEGEAVQAINKKLFAEAYHEMAQVIACWARMWYEVKRMEVGLDNEEAQLYERAK